jgi:uncharacterized membrane protein
MTEPDTDHVEMTVQRMAELHARHLEAQSPLQRWVTRWTAALSRPRVSAVLVATILTWVLLNVAAPRLGWAAWDAPPFQGLATLASVAAFFTTLMILATQAREEEAARHRSQLTLQLASLSEQKIAKVIQLLQEQRLDNPQLANRLDQEAEAMSQPADPAHVLDRIKDTHQDG